MKTVIVAGAIVVGIVVCAFIAGAEETIYPVSSDDSPIQLSELRGILKSFGIMIDRFSYSVPFTHTLTYRVAIHQDDKVIPFGSGEMKVLPSSTQHVSVLSRVRENELNLAVRLNDESGGSSATGFRIDAGRTEESSSYSLEEYSAYCTSTLAPQLRTGVEMPLWIFSAGTSGCSSIKGEESIEDYIQHSELAIVVYVTVFD